VIVDGLFETTPDGAIALIGGYSPTSGQYHFPLADVCPYSGAQDVERVILSSDATLWGWTAVTAAPPGYTGAVPYGFGVVELVEERLRVITRITEPDPTRLSFGQPMHLVADTVPVDDAMATVWAFAPGAGG
jgi:uncharacterized protein